MPHFLYTCLHYFIIKFYVNILYKDGCFFVKCSLNGDYFSAVLMSFCDHQCFPVFKINLFVQWKKYMCFPMKSRQCSNRKTVIKML